MSPTIPSDLLKHQVEAYKTEKAEHYDLYARVLKSALERACSIHLAEAFVQARPKSVDSFAEKCARKFHRYPDAVNQMTDLCGARVIVQTLDQVKAVRAFIKSNFAIVEEDEKGASFADAEFGYRDVHYIVQIKRDCCPTLGISDAERDAIGERCAEIQVRTWMQHAWADTLHDRMYKTKLRYPREFRRVAGLLAALMEDGDRSFNRLATDIDGMLANYNAYAAQADVEREVAIQKLVMDNIDSSKKPKAALQLARLVLAQGKYVAAIDLLNLYADSQGHLRPELLAELGYALCKNARQTPACPDYKRGLALLSEAAKLYESANTSAPSNLRKQNSLHAKALARKAWALEAVHGHAHEVRASYQAALELEPSNPYYLTDVIGHEINWLRKKDVIGALRASIRTALATCREHMDNGTEMPFACFTAGRLHLLLNEELEALKSYARGLAHVLSCDMCVPPDILDAEEAWVIRVVEPEEPQGEYAWTLRLFSLARRVKGGPTKTAEPKALLAAPVLILSGGAASLSPADATRLMPILERTFTGLCGTVISGGTRCGIPGCVGAAADALGPARAFKLQGYRPVRLPDDAPNDTRYDLLVKTGGAEFSPEQIIRYWEDLCDAGIGPDSVRLIGYGGGSLSAFEYRLALALGATVGAVESSGGAVGALLADPLWAAHPNLLALPFDPDTLRAFAHPAEGPSALAPDALEKMAQAFHANYIANSAGKLPPNMKPWAMLDATFKTASREQAKYAINILEAGGFAVRPVEGRCAPAILSDLTDAEVERMAELEHGRWNVERLRNGWRCGPRDDAKKRHNNIVPWSALPDGESGVKKYDRESVRKFPEILAHAGLEVYRPQRG